MKCLPTCSSISAISNWRKPRTGPIAQVRSCYRYRCEQLQQRSVDTTMKWHCLSKVSRHLATCSFGRCLEYSSAGSQLLFMTTSSSSSLWFLLWSWSPKREMHFLVQSELQSGWMEFGNLLPLRYTGVYDWIWQLQPDHAQRQGMIIKKYLWLLWQWKFKFDILKYITMCDTISFWCAQATIILFWCMETLSFHTFD